MAKYMIFMCLLSLVLLIQNIDASSEFVVESTTCNQWNEKSRLQVGDTIVYMYEAEKSLVVQIRQEDYIICNAPSPVDATKSSHGYSVVKLNHIGPHYSVSGMVEINNNDKIIIQVLGYLTRSNSTTTPASIFESPSFLSYYLGFFICIETICLLLVFICICNEERQLAKFIRLIRMLAT